MYFNKLLKNALFKLEVILLIMEGLEKLAITHLSIDSQVTHPVVAIEKVSEQHILTKCS